MLINSNLNYLPAATASMIFDILNYTPPQESFDLNEESKLSYEERTKFILNHESWQKNDIKFRKKQALEDKLSDSLLNIKVDKASYEKAKTYLLETMTNITQNLKSKGYDTSALQLQIKGYEAQFERREQLKSEITRLANDLAKTKDKEAVKEKTKILSLRLSQYSPYALDENYPGNFLTLVFDELSSREQEDFLKAMASIKSYKIAEFEEGIILNDNRRMTWKGVAPGIWAINIQDNENLAMQIQIANEKKVANTLFNLFEDRNFWQKNHINQLKANEAWQNSKEDSNPSLKESSHDKAPSKLLQRVLKEVV